jgi:hypothetical protein
VTHPLLRHPRLGPAERARLIAEVVVTYAWVRWLVSRHEIGDVVERLRGDVQDQFDADVSWRVGKRLNGPVLRTLGPLPWDSRCLMRSLVVVRMLARRGVRGDLVIGARAGTGFEAHAWVEHAGRPVLPRLDYVPLTTV